MTLKVLDQVVYQGNANVLTVIETYENTNNVKLSDGEKTEIVSEVHLTKVSEVRTRSKFDLLKMYVVVDSSVNPVGLGINGAVHAAYAAGSIAAGAPSNECIDYNIEGSSEKCNEWIGNSYRNVTCTGTSEDIATAIEEASKRDIPYYIFYEPDWLEANGRPLAVAFGPEYVWPEIFSKFELHTGSIKRPDTRSHR